MVGLDFLFRFVKLRFLLQGTRGPVEPLTYSLVPVEVLRAKFYHMNPEGKAS